VNLRTVVRLGAPLATALLLALHPWPYEDLGGELLPIAGWWTTLHVIGFVLVPLAGAALWLLTDGVGGTAVGVSRSAALIFAVFYTMGDAIAGIAAGLLAQQAAVDPQSYLAATRLLVVDGIAKYVAFGIAAVAWVVGITSAMVALARAGAPRASLLPFFPAAGFGVFDHAIPFGVLAFGSFFAGAAWLERAFPPARRPAIARGPRW
jgi:hypothetical protein